MRVEILESYHASNLRADINRFLDTNDHVTIIDIKIAGYKDKIVAMIQYQAPYKI